MPQFHSPTYIHPEDFARLLDAQGILSELHHCAQPLMEKLGVNGTIRASFYIYNDESDADAFFLGSIVYWRQWHDLAGLNPRNHR